LWTKATEGQRAAVAGEQSTSLRRMHEVLRGERCVSELIASHYLVHWGRGTLRTGVNCRGCPSCRATVLATAPEAEMCRVALEPRPSVTAWPGRPEDPLARARGSSPWLSLTWQAGSDRDDLLRDLLERLVGRGMNILGGPGLDARQARRVQDRARSRPVVTDYDGDLLESFAAWVIWVLDDGTEPLAGPIRERLAAGEPTYLIHHRDLPDPDRPGVPLAQVHPTISLRAALGAL
jgi:ATP-dependent DNA helicase RecQ